MKPGPNPLNPPEPMLVFGAHPDDAEFGCGGILVCEARAGRKVHLVLCSRGESGSNGTAEERAREATEAAQVMGTTLEFVDLGGDGTMAHTPQRAIVLAAIIRRIRPAVVLAPSVVENQHPDHVVVGRLVRDAARLARYGGLAELKDQPSHGVRALHYYAVTPDAEPRDLGCVLVDISAAGVVETWSAAMRAHATQLRTRDYVGMQLNRARLNGARCGVAAAVPLFPADAVVVDTLSAVERTARGF